MQQNNEIEVRIWPFKLSVKGDRAIAAIKWPLAVILVAVAIVLVGMI